MRAEPARLYVRVGVSITVVSVIGFGDAYTMVLKGLFEDSFVLRGCELTTLFMLMKSAGQAMSLSEKGEGFSLVDSGERGETYLFLVIMIRPEMNMTFARRVSGEV